VGRAEEAQEKVRAVEQRLVALEGEVEAAKARLAKEKTEAQEASVKLAKATEEVKSTVAENARLVEERNSKQSGSAELIEATAALVQEREAEMSLLTKQVRERENKLEALKQKAIARESEVQRQTDEATAQKDQQILAYTSRCLTERETLLSDIANSVSKCEEARAKMGGGYVEDYGEKGKKIQELHQTYESGVPSQDAKEKRLGEKEKAQEVSLRCAKPMESQHRTQQIHSARRQQQQGLYETMGEGVSSLRGTAKSNRSVITQTAQSMRRLKDQIAAETKEFNREMDLCKTQIALTKEQQVKFETENKALFSHLKLVEKNIKGQQARLREARNETKRLRDSSPRQVEQIES